MLYTCIKLYAHVRTAAFFLAYVNDLVLVKHSRMHIAYVEHGLACGTVWGRTWNTPRMKETCS